MSSTRRQIRLECGRLLKARDDDAFWEYVNTGTSASQITDATNLASTRFTSQKFQDYWLRVSDATASAPDGEKVYARTLVPSTGVLGVSPDVSAAFASGETGELWQKLDPDNVDRCIDRAATQLLTRWRMTPISWLIDADFLVDDLSDATPTHWPGTSATVTVTNRTGIERFSDRVLRVLNTGANGYAAQSLNNPYGANTGGETQDWYFSCLVQADVGTAAPIIYDVTNAAALTQSGHRTSWAGEGFQRLSFTVTSLATTEVISVRLGAAGASDDTYWGPVTFYPTSAKDFTLPTRIFHKRMVGRVVEMSGNDWPEVYPQSVYQPRIADQGGGSVGIQFACGVGSRALYYEEFCNYPAFTATYNTATARRTADALSTDCPLEYIAWGTVRELLGADVVEEQWLRAKSKYQAKLRVSFDRDWR